MAGTAHEFHFNLVDQDGSIHSTGNPVNDRDQAFAVAKRLAIDIAETRPRIPWQGLFCLGDRRYRMRNPS